MGNGPSVPSGTYHLPRRIASYDPTLDLKSAQEILFKVRAFSLDPADGQETLDFGDATPGVTTRSGGNREKLNLNGYAVTSHCYEKPGRYLFTVF